MVIRFSLGFPQGYRRCLSGVIFRLRLKLFPAAGPCPNRRDSLGQILVRHIPPRWRRAGPGGYQQRNIVVDIALGTVKLSE